MEVQLSTLRSRTRARWLESTEGRSRRWIWSVIKSAVRDLPRLPAIVGLVFTRPMPPRLMTKENADFCRGVAVRVAARRGDWRMVRILDVLEKMQARRIVAADNAARSMENGGTHCGG